MLHVGRELFPRTLKVRQRRRTRRIGRSAGIEDYDNRMPCLLEHLDDLISSKVVFFPRPPPRVAHDYGLVLLVCPLWCDWHPDPSLHTTFSTANIAALVYICVIGFAAPNIGYSASAIRSRRFCRIRQPNWRN